MAEPTENYLKSIVEIFLKHYNQRESASFAWNDEKAMLLREVQLLGQTPLFLKKKRSFLFNTKRLFGTKNITRLEPVTQLD